MYDGIVSNSNLSRNHANKDGGAVYNVIVANCLFESNNATNGGDGKPRVDYDLVVKTYQELNVVKETANKLNVDEKTVRRILRERKITIIKPFMFYFLLTFEKNTIYTPPNNMISTLNPNQKHIEKRR